MTQGTHDDGIVVLDFETTGMSPPRGDRAIEVGAVRIVDERIVDRFQSLMDPGRRISRFIEQYTGITPAMVRDAPPAAEVMAAFADFIGDCPLVAHNAAFDRRFLDAEFERIGCVRRQEFTCSLRVARRLYPEAPNHKLGTLVRYKQLPTDGRFHRALADAEMTAHLWLRMGRDLREACGLDRVSFVFMSAVARLRRNKMADFVREQSQKDRN
jgi:DNA polymerase-3 subunit epsilon